MKLKNRETKSAESENVKAKRTKPNLYAIYCWLFAKYWISAILSSFCSAFVFCGAEILFSFSFWSVFHVAQSHKDNRKRNIFSPLFSFVKSNLVYRIIETAWMERRKKNTTLRLSCAPRRETVSSFSFALLNFKIIHNRSGTQTKQISKKLWIRRIWWMTL